MNSRNQWRDNAGIYASAGAACEFFLDLPCARGGEYRLSVYPEAYQKNGRRKRGAAWCASAARAYDAGAAGFCIERIGRDMYYDRFKTIREAQLAAESVLAEFKSSIGEA